MNKKYAFTVIFSSIVMTVLLYLVLPSHLLNKEENIQVLMNLRVQKKLELQIYYKVDKNTDFNTQYCVTKQVIGSEDFQSLKIDLPTKDIVGIRIDLGENPGFIDIKQVNIKSGDIINNIDPGGLDQFDKNQIDAIQVSDEYITLKSEQIDPYLVSDLSFIGQSKPRHMQCAIIILICTLILFSIIIRPVVRNIRVIYAARKQIATLAMSDFKSRYSGAYFGRIWGFLQPLMTIVLFWFVFQVGFRSQPVGDYPFILWLVAGMIPWNYFADAWSNGTGAFTSYSYIVKKVVFNIDILPLVKILSSFILNIVFNVLLILIFTIYNHFPGIHIIDMIYFSLCLACYSFALSLITATLNVFVKDIAQLLSIIIQILMWMTPMMWQYTMIPEKYSWFYQLNPLHYIINGYRESLLDGIWFYERFEMMIGFWGVTVICMTIGLYLLKKLKPHFADVL